MSDGVTETAGGPPGALNAAARAGLAAMVDRLVDLRRDLDPCLEELLAEADAPKREAFRDGLFLAALTAASARILHQAYADDPAAALRASDALAEDLGVHTRANFLGLGAPTPVDPATMKPGDYFVSSCPTIKAFE